MTVLWCTQMRERTEKVDMLIRKYTGKINSDLAGKLPFKSFGSSIYIMVMYEYGRNVILTEAKPPAKDNQ